MKTIKRITNIILILTLLNMLTSCHYYYKVNHGDVEYLQKAFVDDTIKTCYNGNITKNQYYIVHYKDSAWHLKDLIVGFDTIKGIIEELPSEHMKYKTTKANEKNRYIENNKLDETDVLNEFHIYTNEVEYIDKLSSIPVSSIYNIELYDRDMLATNRSWTIGSIPMGIALRLFTTYSTLSAVLIFYISTQEDPFGTILTY